ncbi:MAG: translation initiation factor IF-2 [Bacteroidales bacterium]
MSVTETKRLSKVAREFNVGISTIIDFLHKKGIKIEENPNAKVSPECYDLLIQEYSKDIEIKKEKEKVTLRTLKTRKESVVLDEIDTEDDETAERDKVIIVKDSTGKVVDIDSKLHIPKDKIQKKEEPDTIITEKKEPSIKIIGKIELEKKIEKKDKKEEVQKVDKIEKSKPEKEEIKVTEQTVINQKEILEEVIIPEPEKEVIEEPERTESEVKVVGKIDLSSINQRTRPKRKTKEEKKDERVKKEKEKKEQSIKEKSEKILSEKILESEKEFETQLESNSELIDNVDFLKTKVERLTGPTVLGKIELPDKKLIASSSDKQKKTRKKKRRRISKEPVLAEIGAPELNKTKERTTLQSPLKKLKRHTKQEVDEDEVQKQIKETLSRLTSKGKSKGVKHRREKREEIRTKQQAKLDEIAKDSNIIKVTEFVTANELAGMMNMSVNNIIQACMSLGMFVSINQRLDAETISLVAEEFGYRVEFVSVELQEAIAEEVDKDEDLKYRPPIVTVMGHVDHGKTSLLDYIRNTNIIAGEAGGITQHIGAYNVTLKDGKRITFLDTPGHEAFTAMRARGAQVTDLAIIVVAADDRVMPQTVEAINHAMAAGVPILFAINKIDKPNANPDKIKEELANMNFLVEEWGGKYQSKDISAKIGTNVDSLMEEVFLAAEILELKANPDKNATGTVIESSLDKGRGFVSTVLISNGTLRVGDIVLAGSYFGKVKAIYNERNNRIDKIGPSEPGVILGLNGAPKAGDNLNVMEAEREAREIATKREQLQREQNLRTTKHITLDEIGRRLAIGNFQELNIIVKGDVDGSIEALSDSLLKLSTEEVQVNIIHKAVGQIAETDVMLAAASDAVIVGFQVRPSISARKLAEKDGIEIRLYSIIYDAINEIKDSISGMLSPITKEEITAMVEVLEVFKITKVGTIAGCMVREGKIVRNSKVRLIRDGIVVYTGILGTLKRFKDDVKEVSKGFECGLGIEKFSDIKVGDVVEAYDIVEIKRT